MTTLPVAGELHVGLTGTRGQPTDIQVARLRNQLILMLAVAPARLIVVHHGMCPYGGVDLIGNNIARELGMLTEGHPSNLPGPAVYTVDRVHEPKPPLDRNDDIAEAIGRSLFAVPATATEQRRGSGTWHAVRSTLTRGKTVLIIPPDGRLVLRRPDPQPPTLFDGGTCP